MTTSLPPPALLQAHSLGIVDNARLLGWVDSRIVMMEAPDAWLIELSSSPPRTRAEIQSICVAQGATAEVDDETFLVLMAHAHAHASMTLPAIRDALMDRFCYADPATMTRLARKLYVFVDEMEWDERKACQTLSEILAPHLRDIEDLLR